MSLPGTYKYVTFMKVEQLVVPQHSSRLLYSVYIVFVVAMIVRYLWVLWEAAAR